MKKSILAISILAIAANVYAFDQENSIKTVGAIGEYTKTEYSITQKFGDYYRSPKAKYVHSFASNGKEAESTEFTSRDVLVDRLTYAYDTEGRLGSTTCTDQDGKIMWKIAYSYDAYGNKVDESEYNSSDVLVNKSIWKYAGKQSEESLYNADGALLTKIITKYDDQGKNSEVATYNDNGFLDQKDVYTYNDAGKLSEVVSLNANGRQIKRVVYRFDSSYTITEKQTYNAENKLALREIYKYDSTGNISKATTYAVSDKFGGTVNELVGISEYSFRYGTGSATLSTVTQPVVTEKEETSSEVVTATIDAK